MSPLNSPLIRATVAALVGVAVALACGPFFGIEVLPRRKEVLLAPPTVSFERELRALVVKPQDELPVVETDDKTRAALEGKELAADVLDRVKKMREQISGEAAYGLGDGLDPAVREYTAGAVSFLHGDTDGAQVHFQAVVTMPGAEQRRSRELWAHYMLGRMAVERRDHEEAVKQFEATRAMVRNGMPDPLGLALASYGEEARGEWQQGAITRAVELYAIQAAYGSDTALNSLVTVAGLILKDDNLLDKGIQDARTRRLLFICVNGSNGRMFFVGPNAEENTNAAAVSTVDRIVAALEKYQLKKVEGAALLASAAYRVGRFDLAQKLCVLEDVPLSDWVKAKLALRRGNREAALSAYEKALEGFAEEPFSTGEVRDIKAETSVLRVSRGEYLQAMDLLYGTVASDGDVAEHWGGFSDYWGDVAYLAERVLTIAELKDYVDHHVQKDPKAKMGERLRSLLARRMMRVGQRGEALRYFAEKEIRDAAQKYGSALDKANSGWRPGFLKAAAWFEAATIARKNGLEILGFEREPDWAMWNGDLDWGESVEAGIAKENVLFESDDERKRVEASKPERPERFQYRLTAVEHATKAADLLPVKSQAFAAVLCQASGWVINREPERAAEIYGRYLRNGAYVKWGGGFARTCPAPDFGVNAVFGVSQKAMRVERRVKAHPVYAGLGVLGGLGIMTAAFYWWWRRQEMATES